MKTVCKGIAAGVLASAFVATASAGSSFQWNWNQGDNGTNNNGGVFKSIDATYSTTTQQLSWSATFGPKHGQLTDGFTLALNDGPNPKGHAGELALLYFDGSDAHNPIVSVYAYNGKNSFSSYKDGDGNTAGNQTPDFIGSTLGGVSWLSNVSVVDNADGTRTFNFDLDGNVVNNHSPLYPDANDEWFGMGFASKVGIWFHSFIGYNAHYTQDGRLTNLNYHRQGWFDGSNINTTVVPLPGAGLMGIAGLAGISSVRRRRRA